MEKGESAWQRKESLVSRPRAKSDAEIQPEIAEAKPHSVVRAFSHLKVKDGRLKDCGWPARGLT
jgi:hypothetical protein